MRRERLLLGTVLLATLALVPGCSDGKKTLYPAQGKALFDGKPMPGAVVWLHPESATPGELRPHAVIGDGGDFVLSTYTTGDGAPAGRYRVTVCWHKRTGVGDDIGPSLLPPRYQDPEKSGLPTVEIASQSNTLPVLNLKR